MTNTIDTVTPAYITRAILAERFPNAVRKKDGAKRPLMLGARKALIDACPDLGEHQIQRFLNTYTKKVSYLRALTAEGAMRVDLAGNEVGPVSSEHAAQAKHDLEQKLARIARSKKGSK